MLYANVAFFFAGTTILVSPWAMHRNPQKWPQPEAFQPERWGDLLAAKPAMAELSNMGTNGVYLPFGAGPRNCIGTGNSFFLACMLAFVLKRLHDTHVECSADMLVKYHTKKVNNIVALVQALQ